MDRVGDPARADGPGRDRSLGGLGTQRVGRALESRWRPLFAAAYREEMGKKRPTSRRRFAACPTSHAWRVTRSSSSASFTGAFAPWLHRWRERIATDSQNPLERMRRMHSVNPAYIPRNHLVEEVIDAAVNQQNFEPLHKLVDVLARPYEYNAECVHYATPPLLVVAPRNRREKDPAGLEGLPELFAGPVEAPAAARETARHSQRPHPSVWGADPRRGNLGRIGRTSAVLAEGPSRVSCQSRSGSRRRAGRAAGRAD